ncbi:MAG: MFS transporter [Cyclobacteriaceae bacterium]|nr:MFS transporter [Cyclobacteriaceae bacterium]MDW8331492.1 MFS transporter [Cyclobacteriaceae bacterium]
METAKPRLSFWQIWNMSFGFLGIQFGFALQNANTSRIFQTLGAQADDLAAYWLAAPITGLIVQPIVGFYSDRTWHPAWGRRRPYFTVGAILASLSLCLMPNSPALWIAVGTLWIMDASINISMEPFRAFVGDMLPPAQRTTGFAMQSFFIGTGAVVASLLPYVFSNWFANTAPEGVVPESVRYAFYVGAFALFVTVMWTVFSSKEYPPTAEQLEKLRNREKRKLEKEDHHQKRLMRTGIGLVAAALLAGLFVLEVSVEREMYVLPGGLLIFGLVFLLAALYIRQRRSYLGIVHMAVDFLDMPRTMVQLAVVQFFSWFALFSMWIYTTPVVTRYFYHATDTAGKAYNDGADWVNFLFAVYNGVAALAAFALPVIARYSSRRVAHLISLILGGAGLASFYFLQDPNWLVLSMIGIGIAWASILAIPYAMLSGSLPPEKMGYYMGVFNFFIVIPQIVAGTLLGFLVNQIFNGETVFVLVTGGISMIIAGLMSLRVDDRDEVTVRRTGNHHAH